MKTPPGTRRGRFRGAALAAGLRLGALTLALSCSACSRRPSGAGDDATRFERSPDAVAQVNAAELREPDVRGLIPADLRESVTGSEVREIIDQWVETELLYQQAQRAGLHREPEVAEALRQMQRQLLADEYLQRELHDRVRVTQEDIQAYYREHTREYTQELHLRHIVLGTAEEAEQVLAQLRAGAEFATLARRHSTDPSAAQGGDLGFLGKGAMNPAFEPVVFQMAPNEVKGPIASSFGFHLVQLVARRAAAEPTTLEVARDEILETLLLEKRQRAAQEILSELRSQATVHMARSYAGLSLEAGAGASGGSEAGSGATGDTAVADSLRGTPRGAGNP